jgi:hypothetical protein
MEDSVRAVLMAVAMAVLVVGLFLIFRAIVLWYWRISEICDTLDAILTEMKKISSSNQSQGEK